ncbi:MAG: hypothetical protein RBT49_02245 [Bacteroidales bacterium]|jgi:hypothetical protein|nr:hypothetical protein [Bacteroidales bacterium]
MFYFNNLPSINYGFDTIRDIFKEIYVESELNNDWFSFYRMSDEQTLHDVSYELYGSINYWWLLAIINGIKDVHFDTSIDDNILQKLAKDLQVLELSNINDYFLFPKNVNVYSEVNGQTIRGKVIDKYIKDNKYYIDVRLDEPNIPYPDECTLSIDSEVISKVTLTSASIYNIGDIVRQDFSTTGGSVEDFVRGHVIIKSGNDLYVYKTKLNEFETTGETFVVDNVSVSAGKLIPVGKKIESILYSNVVSSEIYNDFQVKNSVNYTTNYLYRYDVLETENNTRSMIKVIKNDYLNAIQNSIISQLG